MLGSEATGLAAVPCDQVLFRVCLQPRDVEAVDVEHGEEDPVGGKNDLVDGHELEEAAPMLYTLVRNPAGGRPAS